MVESSVHHEITSTQREDAFYSFLAGAAKAALLASVIKTDLPSLLADRSPMTAGQIIGALALQPFRGRKWLLLLRYAGLLDETWQPDAYEPTYTGTPLLRALFKKDGRGGWFFRDFMRYWDKSTSHDVVDVIMGGPVPEPVPYPPKEPEDVEALHKWMREGARETLESIIRRFDFSTASRVLDVGGGDATMAAILVKRLPHLHVTVFNLPQACFLARQTVAKAHAGDKVTIVDGDFFKDSLPTGYDLVMFSRVLADWPVEVCRMLLAKAYAALTPGGQVLICEPFANENPDLTIAWEHSYLPYDDFGYQVYKPVSVYQQLLYEAGFSPPQVIPRDQDTIHGILVSRRM
ncbi:MAG: methyltransferase [Chloroflexi bacterium]|nr:methyltransferase [Chloroflexota bacterium]